MLFLSQAKPNPLTRNSNEVIMKTIFFSMTMLITGSICFGSMISYAAGNTQTAESNLPVGISFSEIFDNFDGSKTISKPLVSVNNQFEQIYEHSGAGFCRLLNMNLVSKSVKISRSETIAKISSEGFFIGYASGGDGGSSCSPGGYSCSDWYKYISQVICR